MKSVSERVISTLSVRPGMSDRELAEVIYGPGAIQQLVNGERLHLVNRCVIERRVRSDGMLGNYLLPMPQPTKP